MIWPADFASWLVSLFEPSSQEMIGIITLFAIVSYYAMVASPVLCVVGWVINRKEKQHD